MIEMQFVRGTALYAASFITLPNRKLNSGWNNAAAYRGGGRWDGEVFFPRNCFEAKLKNYTTPTLHSLRVNKMEHAVVRPDSGLHLLVCADALRRQFSKFCCLGCFMKFAILCESARGIELRLVDCFRVGAILAFGMVVSFVNKREATILNLIMLWSIGPQG